MASVNSELCTSCMNCYNGANHQDMELHCGHSFCLSCLIPLHSSGNHKCPDCCADWVQFELKALALLKPQASTNELQEVSKVDIMKQMHLCKKHEIPLLYWQEDEKTFYCERCVIDKVSGKLVLIDDAIPLITADIAHKVIAVHKQGREDKKILNEVITDFNGIFDKMQMFQIKIKEDLTFLAQMIKSLKLLLNDRSSALDNADELENDCKNFKSKADLEVVLNARNILEELVKPAALPVIEEGKMASYKMVPSLAELFGVEPKIRNLPSAAAALIASQLTSDDEVLKLLIEHSLKNQRFKANSSWTVDNKNYQAALLALSHGINPTALTLIALYDQPNALPKWAVSAIAQATAGAKVSARFLDAFYKPQLSSNNNEELKSFLLKVHLKQFVGHLDAPGIASLPTSISILGLAINSAADAEAVSNLKTWKHLTHLCVAVCNCVPVEVLQPLPCEAGKVLHFFGLADDQIRRVRPVISALVPKLSLVCLYLPNCKLTPAGLRSLVQLLQGTTIDKVGIELPSKWDPVEKTDLETEIQTALQGTVIWEMDYLYR